MRVAKLEDRVGNVKLLVMLVSTTSVKRESMVMITKINFTARVRLGLDAKVNKNTSVKARITTGSID